MLAAAHVAGEFASVLRVFRDGKANRDDAEFTVGGEDAASLRRRVAEAARACICAKLYTIVPPSRGLEISSLQLSWDSAEQPSAGRDNLLVVQRDGCCELRLAAYKTAKSAGEATVPIPADATLAQAIAALKEARGPLGHDFVFVGADGRPVVSSGKWSRYLNAVFGSGLAATQTVPCGGDPSKVPQISVNSLRKVRLPPSLTRAALSQRR